MSGILTAIQRFSLHDGPGIRSTVFFKGCNMRCKWCHNPETLQLNKQVLYYQTKCVGCGACTQVCSLHTIGEDGKMIFSRNGCTNCGKCTDVCFTGALELCGYESDAQSVLSEVLQDKDYYDQSHGGVTLSGGEVLLQPEFALELLKALKENGISTAIESNLNVDFSVLKSLLPYLDLVMCDLKIWDSTKHTEWTGSGNEQIKENIQKLSMTGIPVIVRTPVIPGVNDTEEEITPIADFVGKLPNLLYYELLNFNPLGGSKYEALDTDNYFKDTKPLADDKMTLLQTVAQKYCTSVRIG